MKHRTPEHPAMKHRTRDGKNSQPDRHDARREWNEHARADWTYRLHSRRLRKLYTQAEELSARIEQVRLSNPCPEHAPTSCRLIAQRIRDLRNELDPIERQIARLQNDE